MNPHGGYTAGTSRCSTCHSTHAAVSTTALLPAQTISEHSWGYYPIRTPDTFIQIP